ncbi:XRE family transcriptional regulator [Janthinobacterium sp. RB2R34]|uniref:XRE family transcriptional regulator n=1 Tax=Janthinobacterium sp. RB2R34 TaxID=3424193 RepID=UPI003F1E9CC5
MPSIIGTPIFKVNRNTDANARQNIGMSIGSRIREARKNAGLTQKQLCSKVGMSQGALSELETGASIGTTNIATLAHALGVSALWLETGRGDSNLANSPAELRGTMPVFLVEDRPSDFFQIPHVKLRLQAGVTGFQTEINWSDSGSTGVPRKWIQRKGYDPEKLISIQVQGESMEPTFYEGDTVVINLADKKLTDNGVFAINYDGEAVVKRVSRDIGEWWLMSDNPDQRKYYRRMCKGAECIVVGRIVRREGDHF